MDVKTAGRTVELFEAFAKSQVPMTLSEIAQALGAPQSSCFSLVRTLEARGYLYSVGGAKRLYPTRKLLEMAESITQFEPVAARVEPILQKLRNASQETVIFGARQGIKVIYLSVMDGPQTIRYTSRAGEIKPMHSSAMGKALLMALGEADRAKILKKLNVERFTDNTIDSIDVLKADLEASAKRGYAITRGENVVDVMAVGVPVRFDNMLYAVAVAGPIQRMEDRADECAALIKSHFGLID